MAAVFDRPLLFLDVDGPLIPFRARPGAGPSGDEVGNPLLGRLDPEDGPRLLALGCELVWATSWMAEANEVIAPRIGLPELAVVEWPDDDDSGLPGGVHWKTRGLVEWAAGRPFVWVDDEIAEADRVFVAARHPGRALLHRVDPLVGLTNDDFQVILRWL